MMLNKQWLIDGQPRGRALLESDFRQQTIELAPLESDYARVRVEILGFDPSMKGQMENIGYAAATSQGDVMGERPRVRVMSWAPTESARSSSRTTRA